MIFAFKHIINNKQSRMPIMECCFVRKEAKFNEGGKKSKS